MANSIRLGGGGSGGSATLITKSITQNGTYLASSDNADGYSEVTVDVSGEGDLIPLSWSGETHTIGNKRSVSVDGYVLNAPCTQSTYCTGVISVPVTMPQGANAIVMEYDIIGASYTSQQWYATFFASDTAITNEVTKEENYGYKQLTQKAISSGTSVVGLTEILSSEFLPSSDNFYINIQFGCTNFANVRIYAVDKAGSVVYEDLSSFAHYYKRNTTTPTITPISSNEVSLTFQDQNATGYELCSFSVPLTKGMYVAEIYATLDKNTGLANRYTWGIYSSNTSGGASLNDNSPLDNTAYDTYVPFDKSDTNEHYYEVPIKVLADGTAYICFAMADDNGVNATITVRSLKIRKAYGSAGDGIDYLESWIINSKSAVNIPTTTTHLVYTNGEISAFENADNAGNETVTLGDISTFIGDASGFYWWVTANANMTYRIYNVLTGTLGALQTAQSGDRIISDGYIDNPYCMEIRRYS